jgi:DNA-binding CsgD family transcriptional regulator
MVGKFIGDRSQGIPVELLSHREMEILQLVAESRTSKEIAISSA